MAFAIACLASSGAWGMDKASYQGSYMLAEDLTSFSVVSDRKFGATTPRAFAANGGEYAGVVTWSTVDDSIALAFSDQRFAFPSPEAASRFLADASSELADGLSPLDGADTIGEQSRTYEGRKTQLRVEQRHMILLFRVGNVVGKLVLIRRADAAHTATMLGIFGNRARRRITSATGAQPSDPKAPNAITRRPPEVTQTTTLKLPATGLTVTLPGQWEVHLLETDDDTDHLKRSSPLPYVEMGVGMREKHPDCAKIIETMATDGLPFTAGVPGYHARGVELGAGKGSLQCADTDAGVLTVIAAPSLRQHTQLRSILSTILHVAQPAASPSISVIARPSPGGDEADPGPDDGGRGDDGRGDDGGGDMSDFGFPHFSGFRAQLDGAYVMPDDARETAFGLAVGIDAGFVTGRTIGFATDFGMGMGYDFDGNVPFDLHAGLGFGVGLGPVSITPIIGLGVDTRGAGDEATTHQMDLAFYWYPGGRLRLRFGPIALEGYLAATFRGSISAEQAVDVGRLSRVMTRVSYIDDGEEEYYIGFRYTKYVGATDENGALRYPGAVQLGGLLGIGFSTAGALDD